MKPALRFYPQGSFPPVSNTERQRQFRERNPDYYRLLKARERAKLKAYRAEREAIRTFTLTLLPPIKPMLMLPAPVEDPTMAAINALRASLTSRAEARESVPIDLSATRPANSSRAA